MVASSSNHLLDAALLYFQRYNWCIIPIIAKTKKPPRGFEWTKYQTQCSTEQNLRNWFSGKYKAMAIVCGAVSGNLGALDFDSPETCAWWNTTHPELARALPTDKTRRGLHVLFQCEPVSTQRPPHQDVELLCKGAYVVVSPSPEKHWLNPPNGEIPKLDPFTLGLERFKIKNSNFSAEALPAAAQESSSSFSEKNKQPTTNGLSSSVSSVPQFLSSSVKLSSVNSLELDDDVKTEAERAIAETVPSKEGEREKLIFPCCRRLRAIFPVVDTPIGVLRPFIQDWHARALPVIGTKPFEITWAAFIRAFARVRRPEWDVLLKFAIKDATADIENPANQYQDETVRLLLRTCYQIQRRMGSTPFGLSYRQAGTITGLSHVQAGSYLEMFVADGYLQIAEAYTYGSRRSTRYRFILRGRS